MDAKHLFESFKGDLTCLMCLGYLTEPMNVRCGHSFCKECLLSCWKKTDTPTSCPECSEIIECGDFFYNRRMRDLVTIGKMLRPHFLQSLRDLTICATHGKENTLFCEEDRRALCGLCFRSPEHKGHKVLPLEAAAGQHMEKLQATWERLKRKKQKCQIELECEKMREEQWEVEGQALRGSVESEYEKMHQFYVEEEWLVLQSLAQEARDNLDSQPQEILSLPMNLEKQPVEMLKLEGQARKWAVKSEFMKKHLFLSEEKQLRLQRLDQELRDGLVKFEENEAKMTQQLQKLQMAMSEIEKNFEKLPIEILWDAKSILERNEELLLQTPEVASPRWTTVCIPGMREMLLMFHSELSLDPETANPHLVLSDNLKSVEYVSVPRDVPDNPKRFDFAVCVLASQSFTSGKHYWEVEVGNKTEWEVGICKESINRKSPLSKLPEDSFTLVAFPFGNYFCLWYSCHSINVNQPIHKVGIFLDYERGHIAFYNAADGTLIYSPPNVTFQGPLRPCFTPCFTKGKNSSGALSICSRSN